MPRYNKPRKTWQYSMDFKAKAVELSLILAQLLNAWGLLAGFGFFIYFLGLLYFLLVAILHFVLLLVVHES